VEIEKEMMASGTTQDVLDLHWKALAKYKTVFEKFVFQNTIVSMQKPLGLVSSQAWSFYSLCAPSGC